MAVFEGGRDVNLKTHHREFPFQFGITEAENSPGLGAGRGADQTASVDIFQQGGVVGEDSVQDLAMPASLTQPSIISAEALGCQTNKSGCFIRSS